MSWQEYVDNHLMVELPHTKQMLESGAIVGLDGGIWAQSPAFPAATYEELLTIAGALQNDDQFDKVSQSGLYLAGIKFMVVPSEKGEVLRGKKTKGGITIKKTNTAMVVGIYQGDGYAIASDCNTVVEKLGDYLMTHQY